MPNCKQPDGTNARTATIFIVSALTKGPVVGFDFPLDAPSGWHEANRYLVWTGRFAVDEPVVGLQEWLDGAAVSVPL